MTPLGIVLLAPLLFGAPFALGISPPFARTSKLIESSIFARKATGLGIAAGKLFTQVIGFVFRTAILVALGVYFWSVWRSTEIANTPLAQLTLGKILEAAFACLGGLWCVRALFTRDEDSIPYEVWGVWALWLLIAGIGLVAYFHTGK